MADAVGQLEIKLTFDTKSMDQGLDEAGQKISKTGQAMQTALGVLAANAVQGVISKVGELASSIVAVGKGFERSMSEVAAISGATGADLELLEKTARDFGASTQFSASEAADALKYMSLAGWDANQSASALGGVLDLASASGMGLAQASDLVTDYLSAFGMEANQSAYFADLLSYAQANSNTTAEALGEAYKNCAANLSAAGQDIETTTALIAMMSNQGLKGSEAGTALNAVIRDMTAKMEEGAIAIGNATVQVMDANGNYRDMTDILLDVEAATNGMGDAERAAALQSTFTSDSIKGLNLIMNAGVSEAAGFEEALRNSTGTASDMAAVMNDNLEGDVKTLGSAFEEFQLVLFEKVEPILRDIVKAGTDVVQWMSENSETVIAIAGSIGAAIVGVFAVNKIKGAINGFKSAFSTVKGILAGHKGDVQNTVASVTDSAKGYNDATEGMATSSETLSSRVSGAINGIKDVITTTLQSLSEILSSITGVLTTAIESLGEILSSAVGAVMEPIKTLLTGVGEAIAGFLQSFASPEILKGALGFAAAAASVAAAILLIGSAVGAVTPGLADFLNTVLLPLGAFLAETFLIVLNDIIDGIIRLTNEALIPFGEFVRDTILDVVNGLTDAIIRLTNEAIIPLIREVKDFLDWLFQKVESVINGVKDTLKKALDWIDEHVIKPIKNLFETVWEKVTDVFDRIGSGIKNALGGAINFIIGAIEGAINGVIKLINVFISAVNKVTDLIGVSLSPIALVSFPRVEFAQGGIVPGNSYSGDRVPAMMNSGEMVLTRKQQRKLWEMVQGGDSASNTPLVDELGMIGQTLIRLADDDDSDVGATNAPASVVQNNNIYSAFDFEQANEALLQAFRGVA